MRILDEIGFNNNTFVTQDKKRRKLFSLLHNTSEHSFVLDLVQYRGKYKLLLKRDGEYHIPSKKHIVECKLMLLRKLSFLSEVKLDQNELDMFTKFLEQNIQVKFESSKLVIECIGKYFAEKSLSILFNDKDCYGTFLYDASGVSGTIHVPLLEEINHFYYDRDNSTKIGGNFWIDDFLLERAYFDDGVFYLDIEQKMSLQLNQGKIESPIVSNDFQLPLEAIQYNIESTSDNNLYFSDNLKTMFRDTKDFFIVMPILGMRIKEDIRLGRITYTNTSGIADSKDIWRKYDTFAQVIISKPNLKDAIDSAYVDIKKSLNLLNMLLRDTSLTYFYGNSKINRSWVYNQKNSILGLEDKVYIEDVQSGRYVPFPIKDSFSGKIVNVSAEFASQVNQYEELEEYFFGGEKDFAENNLLRAMDWLSSSIKYYDVSQRVL